MAIQINPSVGGTAPVVPSDPSSGAGPTSNQTQLPPQYQFNFAGVTRSVALGLSQPSSVGDLEVLFAQIASGLKDSLGEMQKMNGVMRSESGRAGLALALAAFDQMTRYGAIVDDNRDVMKKQDAILEVQVPRQANAQAAWNGLEASRSPKQAEFNQNAQAIPSYQTELGTLNGQIFALERERDATNPKASAARIAQINAQLGPMYSRQSFLNSEIPRLQGRNSTLSSELTQLKTQMDAQQSIIDDAKEKVDTATKTKAAAKATVERTLTIMDSFIDDTVIAMKLARGNAESQMGRDAGLVGVEGDTFDTLLSNMARAVVALGEALSQGQIGLDVVQTTDGAGLNLEQSLPDRFGMQSAPVARAMAFAGLVAGTLAVVADLLRTLAQGMGMQTAGGFAAAGEPRVRVPL